MRFEFTLIEKTILASFAAVVVEKDIFLIGGHDMSRDVYVYDTTNPTTAPAQISSSLPSKKKHDM